MTASGNYTNYFPYYAFDKYTGDDYVQNFFFESDSSGNSIVGEWIMYEFDRPIRLVSVKLTNPYYYSIWNLNNVCIKKFEIQGSNDGSTFTSLGQFDQQNTSGGNVLSEYTYKINSTNKYKYIKFVLLQVYGTYNSKAGIKELEYYFL